MAYLKNKYLFIVILFFTYQLNFGQTVLKSTDVKIGFFSSAPLEDIEAVSEKGIAVIIPEDKTIVFQVTIRSFNFSRPLMQQHFNESYMESDKYPMATFKGKILDDIDFHKDGNYPVTTKGKLNIHGVEQERLIKGIITIKNKEILLTSNFDVACKDHLIKIPSIVFKKVAEVINVNLSANFKFP